MQAKEIRSRFLKFFESKGHKILPSSSLVPHDDPTLLFANAGMNQFKDFFTGKATPESKRVATVQKCARAGGKHNDLENVGFTARHQTFFEMLGNFSFGDYFKKEAIQFAWEFLTKELGVPEEKLYVSVHDSDDEAERIWHLDMGVPMNRIFRMGDKDNFWEMGDTGPCGPCSEIYYDYGPKFTTHAVELENPLQDEGRFVEIWNLVFMQYEQTAQGRIPLPNPCVDTGAGLERVATMMAHQYWNYDTDLFIPIIKKLEQLSHHSYQDSKYTSSMRVIADHIRASTMLITDGVIPSNEGRGYVLRRIIRRAVRHVNELGLSKPTLHLLIPSVFEILGEAYPENLKNEDLAVKMIETEEIKFRETLSHGLKILNEEMAKLESEDQTLFPGESAFKLYDSFGFPLDLTEVILKENNFELDSKGFENAMQAQKERSRAAGKFGVQEDNKKLFFELLENFGETKFLGYFQENVDAQLLKIIPLGEMFGLIFNQTPFYGESGGQVGDSGAVKFKNQVIAQIIDTQKEVDHLWVHYTNDISNLKEGENYTLCVDQKRREKIKKNHSATHLLQAALIKVLGPHIKQAGSSVDADRLRFDFTHTQALSQEEINQTQNLVNQAILSSLEVTPELMNKEKALEKGAMALFGEKYGDEVRVITMGDFSTELCGGIHVRNTQEIGLLAITLETSLASGIRRIEAMTSTTALDYFNDRSLILKDIERLLSTKSENLALEIQKRDQVTTKLKKEIDELKLKILSGNTASGLFQTIQKLNNGIEFVVEEVETDQAKELRVLSDQFINQNPDKILLLLGHASDKTAFLLRRHKNKSINLNTIAKPCLENFEARGGGKPDLIQGSGNKNKKDQFIQEIKKQLEDLS